MTPELQPAARCECGRRPPIRITAAERERMRIVPPDEVVANYRCQCGRVVELPAKSYATAA